MDILGELRVKTLVAFIALHLELVWRRRAVDTYGVQLLNRVTNISDFIDLATRGDIRH